MEELNRKSLTLELKEDGEGEFSAVFATFNVVDHDGDVTRPGAFAEGAEVIIGAFGHDTTSLPVGKGVIRQTNESASVYGKFFLDTDHGRQTYQTVKNLGPLQEWSYIYNPLKRSYGEFAGRQVRFLEEIKVYSVDPVLAGAGIGTRTTGIKTRTLSFTEHCEEIDALLAEFSSRVKERVAVRGKEGRTLSAANVGKLSTIAESLKAAAADLEQLITDAEPKSRELEQAYLRYQRIRAAFLGVA